jgi:hypothetical protein
MVFNAYLAPEIGVLASKRSFVTPISQACTRPEIAPFTAPKPMNIETPKVAGIISARI